MGETFQKSQNALPEPSLSEVLIRVTASVHCRSNLNVQKGKIAHYIMTILVMLFVLMAQGVPIVFANELSGRLIIVTSFPENVFNRFKSAFNERHPRIKIHVRSKKHLLLYLLFRKPRVNQLIFCGPQHQTLLKY